MKYYIHSMLANIFLLHAISDIQPSFDVRFLRFCYSQHSMLADTNVANIYVSTSLSVLS